jgi:hypothetical protein
MGQTEPSASVEPALPAVMGAALRLASLALTYVALPSATAQAAACVSPDRSIAVDTYLVALGSLSPRRP